MGCNGTLQTTRRRLYSWNARLAIRAQYKGNNMTIRDTLADRSARASTTYAKPGSLYAEREGTWHRMGDIRSLSQARWFVHLLEDHKRWPEGHDAICVLDGATYMLDGDEWAEASHLALES